jgi:hypothetical protein
MNRWQGSWRVEPLQPGKHSLQPPTLTYQLPDGGEREVQWRPIDVQVTTQVQKADLKTLQDIPGIETLPPDPESTNWLPLGVLSAVGTLIILGILLRLRRRPGRPPLLPPDQVALQRLDELTLSTTATPDQVAAFYNQLSRILRDYLQAHWELPAEGCTSAELCDLLARQHHVPEQLLAQVRNLFQQCDLARFTPLATDPERGSAVLALARIVIHDCRATATPEDASLNGNGRKQLDRLQRPVV